MRSRSLSTSRLDNISSYSASILESKENLRRLQEAVREWRRNTDHNNCSTTDNHRATDPREEATKPVVCREKNRNSRSCLFLSKNKDIFMPLSKGDKILATETNTPMRKCHSDVFLTEARFEAPGDHEGITISDLFEEATIFASKGPSKTTSLANMLRSLSPILRKESKHYTTPNQSSVNSPRDVQPAPTVLSSHKITDSKSHNDPPNENLMVKPKLKVESETAKTSDASVSEKPPESRNNFSRVDVMSTITEMSSRTSSRQLPPGANSGVSLDSPVSTRSEWKLETITTSPTTDVLRGGPNQGKYMHNPPMSKCCLCERYGYQNQVIFCTDGMRWNTPVPKEPNIRETRDVNRSTKSELGLRPPSPVDSLYSPYARDFSRHAESFNGPYRFLKPLDIPKTPSNSRSCSRSKWQSSDKMRLEYPVKPVAETSKRRCVNRVESGNTINYNSPYNSRSVLQKLTDIYNGNCFIGRNRKLLPPLKRCPMTTKNLPTVETVKLKQKLNQTQKKDTPNKRSNRKLNPMKTVPKVNCKDIVPATKKEVRINVRIPRCSSTALSPAYPRRPS